MFNIPRLQAPGPQTVLLITAILLSEWSKNVKNRGSKSPSAKSCQVSKGLPISKLPRPGDPQDFIHKVLTWEIQSDACGS